MKTWILGNDVARLQWVCEDGAWASKFASLLTKKEEKLFKLLRFDRHEAIQPKLLPREFRNIYLLSPVLFFFSLLFTFSVLWAIWIIVLYEIFSQVTLTISSSSYFFTDSWLSFILLKQEIRSFKENTSSQMLIVSCKYN